MKKKLCFGMMAICLVALSANGQTMAREQAYADSVIRTVTYADESTNAQVLWKDFVNYYQYPKIPTDKATGLFIYNQVLEFDSVNQKTLFERAEQWLILSYFQIMYTKSDCGKIIASATTVIPHKTGTITKRNSKISSTKTKIDYLLTLTIKDNKIKYDISELRYYVSSYDSENIYPYYSLFPIFKNSQSDWLRIIDLSNVLYKTLMTDIPATLANYVNYTKADYDF